MTEERPGATADWDGAESRLDPARDALVREALRSLPSPEIPAHVSARIAAAIAAEASSRASARSDAAVGATRRSRARAPRVRWLVASAGAAAATIIGIAFVVGTTSSGGPTGTTAAAATVSMGASGTAYSGADLASQVGARWHAIGSSWSIAPQATRQAGEDLHSAPSVVRTMPGESPPAQELVATSFATTDEGVADCLRRVAPGSTPLMIDLGTYDPTGAGPGTPAAVLAFAGRVSGTLDVYVVDRLCSSDAHGALAHTTATTSSD